MGETSYNSKKAYIDEFGQIKKSTSANYCINCGCRLPLDAKFCPECGTKVVIPVNAQEETTETITSIKSEVGDKVIAIISDKLGVSKNQIRLNSTFVGDLNADSLDTVELIMEFEKEFGLSISDEDTSQINTVKDAINYIKKMTS